MSWDDPDVDLLGRSPSGVTVGAFDGVHRGHQALLRWFVKESHAAGWKAVVLTFDPLPRQLLGRGANGVLSDVEDRVAYLDACGSDATVVLPFTEEIAAIPADGFVRRLISRLGMQGLWVGRDTALGRGGEGNVPYLRESGARYGFDVRVFNDVVTWGGAPVRSSRIRKALRDGDLAEANGCLGRPYRLTACVVHGDKRGHQLGFPTANLEVPPERLRPANGVYVCRVRLAQGTFAAITNVGTRPTFNNRPPTVEAHLLDFSGDLYGQRICIDFLHRLRAEERFPSAEALVAQMREDEAHARAWLARTELSAAERDDHRHPVEHPEADRHPDDARDERECRLDPERA